LNRLKLVIRIGGSILGSPPRVEVVESYVSVISSLVLKEEKIGVVVGGGSLAREFIHTAKKLGLRKEDQDIIAIDVSRINARLFSMKLGLRSVPKTIGSMISTISTKGVAVMGGLRPGITTDTVAAILAGRWKADLLIKCSDQAGIYTADPKKFSDAKKLDTISYEELSSIVGSEHQPGIHSIVDPLAVKYLKRKRVRIIVVDGNDPKNLIKAVKGEKIGTVVY
jgi:uridylate kinase